MTTPALLLPVVCVGGGVYLFLTWAHVDSALLSSGIENSLRYYLCYYDCKLNVQLYKNTIFHFQQMT